MLVPFGKFAGLYQTIKGKSRQYFALHLPVPGKYPGTRDLNKYRIVGLNALRLPVLREATIRAAELAEKGELTPEQLEMVLDYLFAELDRRLNKKVKSGG